MGASNMTSPRYHTPAKPGQRERLSTMRTFSQRRSYRRRIIVAHVISSAFAPVPGLAAPAGPPRPATETEPVRSGGSAPKTSSRESVAGEGELTSEGYYLQGEGNLSIIAQSATSDSPGTFFRAFGFSAKGGHRWHDKAVFVTLEASFWRSPLVEGGSELVMATNLGVGGEILSAGGLLRTSLAFGPSILTIPPKVDEAGKVGIFLDFRPIGCRFRLSRALMLGVDPLSFHLVVPVLSGIPLIEIEYRTSVYVEHAF
jgi:hypothetical protein